MGQAKAAAQRKLGFTARIYYAGLCGVSYALTGTKYSIINAPKSMPKLEWVAVLLLVAFYLCQFDIEQLIDSDFPLIFVLLIPFWIISILANIHDKSGAPLEKLPPFIWHLILPLLFILTPFGDLRSSMRITSDAFMAIGVPFLIFTIPVYYKLGFEYVKEHPEYRKMFIFGRGGAARWGGLYSFLKYDFNAFMNRKEIKHAPIYCGGTLWFDDVKLNGRHVGLDSDSMMLTVAAMGGGKSLYAAWNTLLSWKGGAFVLDPKGEHAQRTKDVRGERYAAHVLDPWGEVKHLYDGEIGATFNPLEEIDIHSPNAKDDIFQIVESCIMQEADENANSKHFRENAQKIMTGVIAHVLSEYSEEHHNLPTIYDIILTGSPEGTISMPEAFNVLVDRMAMNDAMGRAPMDAAKVLKEAGENERGGFITTLATGLSWVNTPVLRPVLMKSSFKLRDIKKNRETVYLVVPFEHMKNHSRFLRTVVSLGLMACREHADHDYKTLYLLDEFL